MTLPTEVVFAKSHHDDGCNCLPVIIWRMNSNARAASRSPFVPCPEPVRVVDIVTKKPKKAAKKLKGKGSARVAKTHTGTVVRVTGKKTVRLSEGATAWIVGSGECFDKKTGARIGALSRSRLLLDTIKPLKGE